jgi:hypothetical protein
MFRSLGKVYSFMRFDIAECQTKDRGDSKNLDDK